MTHTHNLTGDTIAWVPCDTLTHCPSMCDCPVGACTATVVSPVSDSFPTCDTCGQCGTVPHSDGIAAEFNKYFPACDTCGQWIEACMCILDTVANCPVCGEPIDWCTGHGDIGDPRGYGILTAHDNDEHARCHWRADCSPRNYWGTLKADVSDDFCPLCERGLPNHYSVCPNHRS